MKSNRKRPPLNALRAFESAARLQSITHASQELCVTHSAISHQIKILEDYLGLQLFDRSGNRVRLSAAGEHLQQYLTKGFEEIEKGLFSLDAPGIQGTVVVSAPPALTIQWLIYALAGLFQKYPDLALQLIPTATATEPIGDVDLCIRYGDCSWSGYNPRLLSHVWISPVCTPSFVADPPVAFDRIPRLCGARPSDWDLMCAAEPELGVLQGPMQHMGNDLAMLEGAIAGLGMAIGNNITVRRYLEAGLLVRPFEASIRAGRSYYLMEAKGNDHRPAVVKVRELITDGFAAMQEPLWPTLHTSAPEHTRRWISYHLETESEGG